MMSLCHLGNGDIEKVGAVQARPFSKTSSAEGKAKVSRNAFAGGSRQLLLEIARLLKNISKNTW